MTRTYSARIVAFTVGAPPKWVDNLLSHFQLRGVSSSRLQGLERQITDDGLLAVQIVRLLVTEFSMRASAAVAIANSAVASRGGPEARFVTQSGLALHFPIAAIERQLRERLLDAIQSVSHVSRGRPPKRRELPPPTPSLSAAPKKHAGQ